MFTGGGCWLILVVLQIVFITASMDDDILAVVDCVIASDRFRKKRRKRGV
jgi:hypothetical protein